MGLLLTSLPIGVITGSMVVANIIDRIKPSHAFILGMPLFALLPAFGMLSRSFSEAFFILFCYGFLSTTVNISINVEANRIEDEERIKVMNRCHGFFSVGFFLFSLFAVSLVEFGITALNQHMIVFCTASVVMCAVFVFDTLQYKSRRHHQEAKNSPQLIAIPNFPIILVLIYATFALSLDGIARSWGGVYVNETFDVSASIGALALTCLIVGITAGRFLADHLIAYLGIIRLSRYLTIATVIGISLLTLNSNHVIALIGMVIIGFGVSTAHPQSIRAVASLKTGTPARNIAAFSMVQTVLMYVGPAFFGLAAHYFGMRLAFWCFVPLALAAWTCSKILGKRSCVD